MGKSWENHWKIMSDCMQQRNVNETMETAWLEVGSSWQGQTPPGNAQNYLAKYFYAQQE